MASLIATITNSVRVFGGGPSTKWGDVNGAGYTMVFGTTKWGESFAAPIGFIKLIENSQAFSDAYLKLQNKLIENNIYFLSETTSEGLYSGEWNYVFPPNTVEAENRIATGWSAASNSATTYTCLPAGSTSWT